MPRLLWSTGRRVLGRGHASLLKPTFSSPIKRTISNADQAYSCNIESESLDKYRPGGYHPVDIHDTFHSGRYRVLHKLGWGADSTVWLVHDHELSEPAALKVLTSEMTETSNEPRILQLISSISPLHDGQRHLRKLIDHFSHDGPNGRHQCLVFDVDDVRISELAPRYDGGTRLPGRLAWELSKQVTLALNCLHWHGIAHGDLHPGNILVSQQDGQFSDPDFTNKLGLPIQADINTEPGRQITKSFPRHIVEPVAVPAPAVDGAVHARLIDFEQSFLQSDKSLARVRTPLIYRAPETLLDSKWDLRIDIWSLACTIFELVTGQPPFDESNLVNEWKAMFGDLPEEWRKEGDAIGGIFWDDIPKPSITDWLREVYFEGESKAEFNKADIERLGDLLTKMMRYHPGDRLSTEDILRHEWFERSPLDRGFGGFVFADFMASLFDKDLLVDD